MSFDCNGDHNQLDLTNTLEWFLFCIFTLYDCALLLKLVYNFFQLEKWIRITKEKNYELCWLNGILFLSLIILLANDISQFVQYYDAADEKTMVKVYFGLQISYIYCYDLTILISSRTLFILVKLKYEGKPEEYIYAMLQHACIATGLVITVVYIVLLILFYLCILNINYVSITIMTFTVSIMFSISSWVFSKHILSLQLVKRRNKRLMKIGSFTILGSSIFRAIWVIINLSAPVAIQNIKNFDEDKQYNQGPLWGILLVIYKTLVFYLPLTYLAILYTPKNQIEGKRPSSMPMIGNAQLLEDSEFSDLEPTTTMD